MISGNDPFNDKVMTTDEGLFVKHHFRLGRDKYQTHSRLYNQSVSVTHPSPAKLAAREKELLPVLHEVEKGGIWARVPDLVKSSLEQTLIHLVTPENLDKLATDDTIKGHFVCGADASGSNPIYRLDSLQPILILITVQFKVGIV